MQMLELYNSFKYDSEEITEKFAKIKFWRPEIIKVNSITGENFDILLEKISKHKEFLENTGTISNYMKNRIKSETLEILKYKLTKKIEDLLHSNELVEKHINEVMTKSLDPYSMANLIIEMLGKED
ncbi:MAG: hypothetical protein ACFFBP_21970, partial [Promethearchaeota archaeon]